MNSSLLSERLAALRAKQDAANPSPLSELSVPHKLATLIILYAKADYECNINYMEATHYLIGYLTYGHRVPLDLELTKYPRIEEASYKIPNLVRTYALVELATLLSGATYGAEHARYERAIHFTTLDLMNRGLI